MKRCFALVLAAALALWQAPAQAQPRAFSQAELDALLAPVALYPDPVLSHILVAATYPDELREAAAWSRANSHLAREDAVRAAETMPWHPSIKALLAFPELLARMDESPQWTADLGAGFLEQEPYVMDTVQALRRRAQASGSLQSNDQYSVQQQGQSIAVYPVQPHIIYLPYYNPYVVYGPWWHAYRPVYWRPWHPRPAVFVSTHFFSGSVDWHRRHVRRAPAVRSHHREHWRERRIQPAAPVTIHNHASAPAAQAHRPQVRREHRVEHRAAPPATIHNHAHPVRPMVQSVVRPLVQSVPEVRREARAEHRRDFQAPRPHSAPVQQPRSEQRRGNGEQRRQANRQQQRRG